MPDIRLFLILLVLFTSAAWSAPPGCSPLTLPVGYVVQPGDSLGRILQRFNLRPIPKGIKKTSEFNRLNNPDLIFPNKILILPFQCEEELLGLLTEDRKDKRIIITNTAIAEVTPPDPAPAISTAEISHPRFSRFSLSGRYDFLRIDAKDLHNGSKAIIASQPFLGLQIVWEQVWSSRISSGVEFMYQKVKMHRKEHEGLEDGNQNLGGLAAYLGWNLHEKWKIKGRAAMEDRLFVSSPQAGMAKLDSLQRVDIGIALIHRVLNLDPFELDLKLDYKFLTPTSSDGYSVKEGRELGLAAVIRQRLKNKEVLLKLHYERALEESNLTEQETRRVGALLGMIFEVGK